MEGSAHPDSILHSRKSPKNVIPDKSQFRIKPKLIIENNLSWNKENMNFGLQPPSASLSMEVTTGTNSCDSFRKIYEYFKEENFENVITESTQPVEDLYRKLRMNWEIEPEAFEDLLKMLLASGYSSPIKSACHNKNQTKFYVEIKSDTRSKEEELFRELMMLADHGKKKEAYEQFDNMKAGRERMRNGTPKEAHSLFYYEGILCYKARMYKLAIKHFHNHEEAYERIQGEIKDFTKGHAVLYNMLGDSYSQLNNRAEGQKYLKMSLKYHSEELSDRPHLVANCLINVAHYSTKTLDFEVARWCLDIALKIRESILDEPSPSPSLAPKSNLIVATWASFMELFLEERDFVGAKEYLGKAELKYKQDNLDDELLLARFSHCRARLLLAKRNWENEWEDAGCALQRMSQTY